MPIYVSMPIYAYIRGDGDGYTSQCIALYQNINAVWDSLILLPLCVCSPQAPCSRNLGTMKPHPRRHAVHHRARPQGHVSRGEAPSEFVGVWWRGVIAKQLEGGGLERGVTTKQQPDGE